MKAGLLCSRRHLHRVLDVGEGVCPTAQTAWAHRGRVQRQGLEGLDAVSRRLSRCGAVLPTVVRFHGWESPDDSGEGRRASLGGLRPLSVGRIILSRGGGLVSK